MLHVSVKEENWGLLYVLMQYIWLGLSDKEVTHHLNLILQHAQVCIIFGASTLSMIDAWWSEERYKDG